jgi:uncharacterized protein YbgA (DUF1722 family)/uncharacterized protein YbbK (DUF523 family)
MTAKIKLGISACLLGEKVRFDGSHQWDRFITGTLGKYVDFVPVCPEVECGFGVPREPMRLAGNPDNPRLITVRTGVDHTDRMINWAKKRVRELEAEELCGFIFKSDSPSNGLERVKVYNAQGVPVKKGVGIFARLFMEHFPLLPVEDEGRLHDLNLRENFIQRLFAFKRWREVASRKNGALANLITFHTRHKLLILSHSPQHYRVLGNLVARAKEIPIKELYSQYQTLLMEALRLKTTPKKNTNVLYHLMGFFKKDLSADEKQELLEIIDSYAQGLLPLIVPITLINHYVRKYRQPYLKDQYYLNPHPLDLQLRNHV